jgi:hypothetical protein
MALPRIELSSARNNRIPHGHQGDEPRRSPMPQGRQRRDAYRALADAIVLAGAKVSSVPRIEWLARQTASIR